MKVTVGKWVGQVDFVVFSRDSCSVLDRVRLLCQTFTVVCEYWNTIQPGGREVVLSFLPRPSVRRAGLRGPVV